MLNVRLAVPSDRSAALELVTGLLTELGGAPPAWSDLLPIYDDLISGTSSGFIVVGEDGNRIVAVCTVSFATALRVRGRYAVIQEMFVAPESRSSGVGMEVLCFALERAVSAGCSMVELGTPFHGERQIRFYERAGFANVGARLRWRP